ncbi:MAG: DUF4091 domain-containing protein [Planctomycetota bacterium]
MGIWTAAVACVLCVAAGPVCAGSVLFDFERDEEIALWHDEGTTTLGADKRLERAQRFAASGTHSMRFFTPAWRPEEHGGRRKWPAFEGQAPVTDWSPYDRLVFEAVNATAAPQRLMLFITDSKRPTRRGLIHRETLPPFGHVQAVVGLRRGFAQKKVDPADIQTMHFFTEDPPEDMVLFIDRLVLLEPGEPLPPVPASYLEEFVALQGPGIAATRQGIALAGERMAGAAAGAERIAAWARTETAALAATVSTLEARLGAPDPSVLTLPQDLARIRDQAAALEARLELRLEFEKVRPAVEVKGAPGRGVVVGFADSMTKVLPRAGVPALTVEAKALGMVDHAYIYGCDEHKPADFPHVERAARLLKQAFPDVMVMTTTYDQSYGLDSVINSVDAFCPLTPRFDPARAEKARARGKQVWWYICCGPHHPHANMFVEYPAIEGRLLMGALTAKYRPDGFLYYQISIWNARRPITDGPFTSWDPRSWTSYHGDGSWTCVGPAGTPLATVRLENFRDGLDDYAYVRVLEGTLAEVEADPGLAPERRAWIAQARALLAVPEEVAASRTAYTRDPAVLRRWRNDLAEAIELAGIAPVEPWGAR